MDDRERIFDFIEQDDPRAAIAVDERVATQVLVPLQFPEGGRPGRVEGTRELVVRGTPYIVGLSGWKGLRSHPANSS
jgi:toxin ParE1/3/4